MLKEAIREGYRPISGADGDLFGDPLEASKFEEF